MKIVIDIPEKLACEGFERPFTDEEVDILLRAIGNGTPLDTELEKIKDSINEIRGDNKYVVSDYMYGAYQALNFVDDIITDMIAELKRESEEEE